MLNPFRWSFRAQFALGFLGCAAMLGYALYADHVLQLNPCPLCILQRVAFMAMGLVFALGALHNPARLGRRIYSSLVALAGVTGAAIAAWHLRLQHLPPELVPDCGPGLTYMLDAFPTSKVISMIFTGSGECAEVDWTFLSLSMPAWTLIVFSVITLGALWSGFKSRN